MGGEWRYLSFNEAVIVNPEVPLKRGEAYPFVDMQSIDPSRPTVKPKQFREFTGGGSRFEPYDTLMARITPSLENGKIARYVPDDTHYGPAFGSTEFIVLRGRKGVTDNDFAFYLTRWNEFRSFAIAQMSGSSGRQRVPAESLAGFEVPVPSLPEQRAIARILGTLDDKIELNRRMNETLEAMAQALFKSWFVDFDPVVVNALKAGNPIPDKFADRAAHYREKPDALGLPREILRLFPDRFVDSELGPIPEGWEVREIKQCCEKVQNGGTPNRREKEYWSPGTIPWLTSSEVRRKLIIETINRISEAGLRHSSAKWLPPYSTVVALYGATAGQVALIATKLTTNQAVCGLVPRKWHRFFNYMALSHSAKKLCSLAVGAAQQNISKAIVESYEIVYPEEPRLIAIFDSLCEPYFVQWKHSLEQSRVLSVLRDTLLAKLMSGELRIPDVEKILEKAL